MMQLKLPFENHRVNESMQQRQTVFSLTMNIYIFQPFRLLPPNTS